MLLFSLNSFKGQYLFLISIAPRFKLSRRYSFLMKLSRKIFINVNAEHFVVVSCFYLLKAVLWFSTLCNGCLDCFIDVCKEDLELLPENFDVCLIKQVPPVKIVFWVFFYLFYVGEDALEVCVFTPVMTAFGTELRFEYIGCIIGDPDAVVCHWCKVARVHLYLISSN